MATSTGIMSNYLETNLLNHVFRGVSFTAPTTLYVTLYTNTTGAGESDTGTELTVGTYGLGRASISLPSGMRIVDNSIYNLQPVSFSEATYNWGTIYGWGIKDAASGGNLLYWGLFDSPPIIDAWNRLYISASQLHITSYQSSSLYGGWTIFSANAIWEYLINATPFSWTTSGGNLALGNTVVVNNTTDNLFSIWTEISISATGYARILMPTSSWSISSGVITNTNDILFIERATANWGAVSDIVLYDSVTGANPIFWGHLNTPVTINAGDGFRIAAGTIQAQFN